MKSFNVLPRFSLNNHVNSVTTHAVFASQRPRSKFSRPCDVFFPDLTNLIFGQLCSCRAFTSPYSSWLMLIPWRVRTIRLSALGIAFCDVIEMGICTKVIDVAARATVTGMADLMPFGNHPSAQQERNNVGTVRATSGQTIVVDRTVSLRTNTSRPRMTRIKSARVVNSQPKLLNELRGKLVAHCRLLPVVPYPRLFHQRGGFRCLNYTRLVVIA